MYSTIALGECMCSMALLGSGTFFSISRDHNQPIKLSEFNEVYLKTNF